MDLRLRRSSPPPPHGTRCHRMDRISALPDDMLLHILAHLGCARSAVQSSLLSRRWRRLCMGLTNLSFRGLPPTTMEAAFRCFAASSPQVSTLDIYVSSRHTATSANSLMRAAMRLSPRRLLFTIQESSMGYMDIELPCFQSTSSIEIDTGRLGLKPLRDGEFTALESLTIAGRIIDLRSLLNRCPRLRVLSISHMDMNLHQTTLPPASVFTALEKLSLYGKIVDLGPLLNGCKRLRELSVTQGDTRLLHIALPPSGEFPVLEKLSLSGNIADLGTLLNKCPRLRVVGVTFRGMALSSIEAGLTILEDAASLGLMLSLLGVIPVGSSCRFSQGNSSSCL
ncbi:hypothetical protein ACQ4PT_002505 [Festuca glaucescens]